MKKVLRSIVSVAVALSSMVGLAQAAKILDPTKTTFQWQVYSEKDSATKLDVVPAGKNKGIRLSYTVNNSNWIALVKEGVFALGEDEGLEFQYETTGAILNFKVKVIDGKGNVFGFTIPAGTAPQAWTTVVIPRKSMTYFYGGNGRIDWSALTKMEFTLDTGAPEGDYVIEKNKPGTLSISTIKSTKAGSAKVPGTMMEKTKGQKIKGGGYLIDAIRQSAKWSAVADMDGTCTLSDESVADDKGTPRDVMKAVYSFGKEGAWVAILKKVKLDLSAMQQLEFSFKGTGGAHTLIVKIMDSKDRVYGYTVNETTAQAKWKKVVVPAAMLKYLYGGPGEAPITINDIVKVEFTIEKKDASNPAGTLFLSWLAYN